jgi:hypothetical protein
MKTNNPVKRHMERYNRPATQRDRKADAKRGYRKHRRTGAW